MIRLCDYLGLAVRSVEGNRDPEPLLIGNCRRPDRLIRRTHPRLTSSSSKQSAAHSGICPTLGGKCWAHSHPEDLETKERDSSIQARLSPSGILVLKGPFGSNSFGSDSFGSLKPTPNQSPSIPPNQPTPNQSPSIPPNQQQPVQPTSKQLPVHSTLQPPPNQAMPNQDIPGQIASAQAHQRLYISWTPTPSLTL